ncbi:MAG: FAD-dependent oxidoreductase [Marinilabiliales bacterium]|nr:FAD-dependent oxidoreductase [Marinilabiliales bacterium]
MSGRAPSALLLLSMIPAAELTEGSLFPEGGMHSIVRRLIEAAEEHGVRFHFNKPVSGITKRAAEPQESLSVTAEGRQQTS